MCVYSSEFKNKLLLITEGISIPADQPIIKLKNLDDVVVPTMEIKVTEVEINTQYNIKS